MALFGNMTNEGHEEARDTLGGYSVLDSGIYTGTIKQFYAGQSSGGAHNMTIIVAGGDFGSEYRETVYFTNKKGENFFVKNDKKSSLPGFTIVDDICLCAGGVPLSETDFEEKTVNIYDYEAKKELPKSVQVATGLIGKEISLAILKNLENQQEKSGDEYVAKSDGSTRETNNIDKVFNTETKMTVHEARHGADEAAFWGKWEEKNKGQTRDRTEKDGAKSGKPAGAAPQGGNAGGGSDSSPRKSLFGNK